MWPPLYQKLFPDDLLNFEIFETKATCDHCAKAAPQYKKADAYQNNLKCCTFQPYIPNFALGAILSDPSQRYEKAKASIRQKLKRREFLLPIGMVASVRYQTEYMKNKKKIFGKDKDYLCSFYDNELNQCGVWHYRGAVCTSFYCFSSYGETGQKFWSEVSDFQTYVEMALMEDAMVHLGYSPRQLSDNLRYIRRDPKDDPATVAELKSWVLDKTLSKKLWADYHDNIEEFYKKCYQHVCRYDKTMYKEAIGEFGEKLERKLIKRLRSIENINHKNKENL